MANDVVMGVWLLAGLIVLRLLWWVWRQRRNYRRGWV